MKGNRNSQSQDSYKILKQNINVSFKTNNKLLIVVKQHVVARFKVLFFGVDTCI